MFLSETSPCRLLIRGGDLGKSMSRYLVDQVERNDAIEVCRHSELVELHGERELDAVTTADNRSGERLAVLAKAMFVFIGASPHTEWLAGQLATDKGGFLLTGHELEATSSPSSTASGRSSSRPAGPASLPSVTSARARSSGSPRRSARARWPCA